MTTRTVAPVDTIWLNMDRPDNLMVVESLVLLDTPLDMERFRRVIGSRVADRYPVYRQRPVASRIPGAPPHWEDAADFDLDDHLHRETLPAPGDDAALQDYVSGHLARPLDRRKPLWEVHVLDGYGDGSAVYFRMHHALADGIALMEVLLSLTDDDPDAEDEGEPRVLAAHRGPFAGTAHLVGQAVHEMPTLLVPTTVPARTRAVLTLAGQTARITTKLLLTRNPDTAISGEVGASKRALWGPPIPLDGVVEAAHATGTTVNDVLVSALAGALHRYLLEHHDRAVDVPTMVPVNVRPLDEPLPAELGNAFALVLMKLPSGLSTPFARLAETKRRMDAIKHSPEPVLTFGLIRGIGRTSPQLERHIVDFFANEASGVTTNVPGPREPRWLAGSRVTGLLGWAPESGRQTLGTCITTYDGQVRVGFKVDALRISSPEQLVEAYRDEVDVLVALGAARPRKRRSRR
jgi:WS/DGAT/MGAT family acyltransferase